MGSNCSSSEGGSKGLRDVYIIDVPLSRNSLAAMYPTGVHPVSMHLIGVHVMGVPLIGVSLMMCLA